MERLISEAKNEEHGCDERTNACPLKSGEYVILPRAWCHKWRRYLKTGEGATPPPPDSSALLCHAHKIALLPPHLEAYLRGITPQLLSATKGPFGECGCSPPTAAYAASAILVGMNPPLDRATTNAITGAGISQAEIVSQQMAMLQIHQLERPAAHEPAFDHSGPGTLSDVLDRENHVVVELLTLEEWNALNEYGGWRNQFGSFAIHVQIEDQSYHISTEVCRECDPTGSRFSASAEVKYRRKRWEPKSVESKRTPKVEY